MKKFYTRIMMLAMMMAAMTTLTSCDDEDDYIAQKLRDSDWEGYIDTYYSSRWSLSGNTYETAMHFESRGEYYTSGRGCEVDYDTRNPYSDYAYCTFSWCIVEGNIILIYDDSMWNTVWIRQYNLYGGHFYGYIDDGTNRNIKFDLASANAYDWNPYGSVGGYGDFSNQNWFRARTRAAEGMKETDDVPFLDRTDIARQESGEADAMSQASGIFAEAMRQAAAR